MLKLAPAAKQRILALSGGRCIHGRRCEKTTACKLSELWQRVVARYHHHLVLLLLLRTKMARMMVLILVSSFSELSEGDAAKPRACRNVVAHQSSLQAVLSFDLGLRNRIRLFGFGSSPKSRISTRMGSFLQVRYMGPSVPSVPYKPRLERSTLYILQPVSSLTFTSSPNPATPKLFKGFRSAQPPKDPLLHPLEA